MSRATKRNFQYPQYPSALSVSQQSRRRLYVVVKKWWLAVVVLAFNTTRWSLFTYASSSAAVPGAVGTRHYSVNSWNWKRPWRIRHRQHSTHERSSSSSSNRHKGTFLTWSCPTRELVASWLDKKVNTRNPTPTIRNILQERPTFNHDYIGMTHPQVAITTTTTQRHTKTENTDTDDKRSSDCSTLHDWWPSTVLQQPLGWRVCRYRHSLVDCSDKAYRAAQRALIDWEFMASDIQSGLPQQGIVRVQNNHNHDNGNTSAQFIPSKHGHQLVTYTRLFPPKSKQYHTRPQSQSQEPQNPDVTTNRQRRLGVLSRMWPRHLYCVNPVQVAYTVLDQAGTNGCTFTSSAFATLQGHWLAGEERVTVIMRPMTTSTQTSSSTTFMSQRLSLETVQVDIEILSFSKPGTRWMRLVWPLLGNMQASFFQAQLAALANVARQAEERAVPTPRKK